MTDLIMPAFVHYKEEGAAIGRLLAGYGELEYEIYNCTSEIIGRDVALKVLFRSRGEKQRIDIADAIIRPQMKGTELETPYCEAIGAMHHCRTIRNQYAHCHWLYYVPEGLFFTNLDEAAKSNTEAKMKMAHTDLSLLQEQEAFFCFTMESFWPVENYLRRKGGRPASLPDVAPPKRPRPLLHNPPEEHPLPAFD